MFGAEASWNVNTTKPALVRRGRQISGPKARIIGNGKRILETCEWSAASCIAQTARTTIHRCSNASSWEYVPSGNRLLSFNQVFPSKRCHPSFAGRTHCTIPRLCPLSDTRSQSFQFASIICNTFLGSPIPSPAATIHFSALAFLRGPPLNKRLTTPRKLGECPL